MPKKQNSFIHFLKHNPMVVFLVFLPLTLAAELLRWSPLAIFILACLAIVPMAAYIGEATEALAHFTGPRIGGLLLSRLSPSVPGCWSWSRHPSPVPSSATCFW